MQSDTPFRTGESGTTLGKPGDAERAKWIGKLVGMTLPPSYLEVVAKHDGVTIDEPVYSVMESMETFSIHREEWASPRLFWPVGGDGCGNRYVLVNSNPDSTQESPVAFIESISGTTAPAYWVASTYAHFVFFLMTRLCNKAGCSKLLSFPRKRAWPFDANFVLRLDPGLERLQPRARWPR